MREYFQTVPLYIREHDRLAGSIGELPGAMPLFVELGIEWEDAFNFIPVGCNELAVPGQWYYNPGAHCGYLQAIEAALARSLPKIQGVELLPYYDLWRAKLDRFGLKSELPKSVKPPGRGTVKAWRDYLRERGVTVVT